MGLDKKIQVFFSRIYRAFKDFDNIKKIQPIA